MFKTRKVRPDLPQNQRSYTSAEVARIAQVSLRQLQWWDEQKVVSPRHEGHKRIYLAAEVVEITVIAELRRKGRLQQEGAQARDELARAEEEADRKAQEVADLERRT